MSVRVKKQSTSLQRARRLLARHSYTLTFPHGGVQIKFTGRCHPDLLMQEMADADYLCLYGRRIAIAIDSVDGESFYWFPIAHSVEVFQDENHNTGFVFRNPSPSGAMM